MDRMDILREARKVFDGSWRRSVTPVTEHYLGLHNGVTLVSIYPRREDILTGKECQVCLIGGMFLATAFGVEAPTDVDGDTMFTLLERHGDWTRGELEAIESAFMQTDYFEEGEAEAEFLCEDMARWGRTLSSKHRERALAILDHLIAAEGRVAPPEEATHG